MQNKTVGLDGSGEWPCKGDSYTIIQHIIGTFNTFYVTEDEGLCLTRSNIEITCDWHYPIANITHSLQCTTI